jgi:DNA-binding NarL/FixJ family response regulator
MTLAPSRNTVKVFLVAENRLLREAVAKLLTKKGSIHVAGAASFSPLILEQIGACQSDILLVDSIPLPAQRLEFIREAIRCVPGLKVVMIGMDADPETFLRSVEAGAVGYVLKDASALDIEAAVLAAARDEAVCPPRLCSFLFEHIARQSSQTPSSSVKISTGLSRREQQLVPLIARGLTNKEIAMQLSISEQTVKNHVHRMLRKLGADDRLKVAEIVARIPCPRNAEGALRQNLHTATSLES